VIHDFVPGPQPAQAPFPYLFSVRMLTWTREGHHSLDTYRGGSCGQRGSRSLSRTPARQCRVRY
jgi:hypothetical protein